MKKPTAEEIVVFSDLHAHNYARFAKINPSGLNSRLEDTIKALTVIKGYCIKNKTPLTLCSGDIVDTFSYVENDVLNSVMDVIRGWPGTFAFIAGNHDIKSKGRYDSKQVATFALAEIENVHYVDDGVFTDTNTGLSIYGLGWQDPATFHDRDFVKADIFMGHQLIENADIPKGMPLPKKFTDKFKFIVFGDIHIPSFQKKKGYGLLIPGAPLQHNFGDEGQTRGFWTVNTETWEAEQHEILGMPKFITVPSIESLKKTSKEELATNFYRVATPTAASLKGISGNITVQKAVKKDFRQSGIELGMSDDALLLKYMEVKSLSDDKMFQAGKDFLAKCESTAVIPSDYLLDRITIRNFGSFQGTHEFHIADGIFLVLGDNGYGKTTYFEAIYWCLFDETTKGVGADTVVNDTVGKDCAVELIFIKKSGDTFIVERNRKTDKGNKLVLTQTQAGNSLEITRESNAETQKILQQTLGTTASFFKNVNYFSQEDFEFFSTMTDAGQKAVCKNLLMLDRFEKAEGRASAAVRENEEKFDAYHENLSNKEAALVEKEGAVDRLKGQAVAWDADHKSHLDAITLRLAGVQQVLHGANVDHQNATCRVIDVEKEWQGVQAEFKPIPQFDPAVYNKKKSVLEDELVNAVGARDQNTNEKKKTDSLITGLAVDRAKLESQIAFTVDKIADLDKQLSAVTTVCSQCGQQLPAETIITLQEGRKALKKTQQETQARLENDCYQLDQKKENLLKYRTELDAQAVEIMNAHASANNDLAAFNEMIAVKRAEHKASIQAEETRQADLKKSYADKIAAAKKEKQQYHEFRVRADSDVATVKAELDAAYKKKNPLLDEVEIVLEECITLHKEIADIEKILEESEGIRERANFWKVGFSNQGIVSFLLDGFAKDFTETINSILLDITNGKYSAVLNTQKQLASGEFREKFELKLYIAGKERPYKALSGGQKAKVNLATVMTLIQIIMKSYNLEKAPFGIVILDEVMSYLDTAGVEAIYEKIVKFFDGIANVYAVSHKEALKALFTNYLIAEFDEETGTKMQLVRQ